MSKITSDGFTRSGTGCLLLCLCVNMAIVGVKWLIKIALLVRRTAGQIFGVNGSWRHPGDLDKNCNIGRAYWHTRFIVDWCSIGHDNAGGPGCAWLLERVEVELPLLHRSWSFPHSRWISKDHGDRTLEHVLYPDNVDSTLH